MANSTIFANVITLRLSDAELVLEFGTNFPDKPGAPLPSTYQPDIRIALPVGMMGGLADNLATALKTRAAAQAVKLETKQ